MTCIANKDQQSRTRQRRAGDRNLAGLELRDVVEHLSLNNRLARRDHSPRLEPVHAKHDRIELLRFSAHTQPARASEKRMLAKDKYELART
eukprot:6178062-Pleurochrysis_carterae.AAC.2